MTADIENALTYETAVELISEEECLKGIYYLQRTLLFILTQHESVSLIPIERGGHLLGEKLASVSEGGAIKNPMRMSHTGEKNIYLRTPVCVEPPDLKKIITPYGFTRPVVFADTVVESIGSIMGAVDTINKMITEFNRTHNTRYREPVYYNLGLVSKTLGVSFPLSTYAFAVNHNIWVHGVGCDDEGRGREKNSIWGRLAPDTSEPVSQPYVVNFYR